MSHRAGLMNAPPSVACRSPSCVSCGATPSITAASLPGYDYATFTGQRAANDAAPPPLQLIAREQRITPAQLQQRWVVVVQVGGVECDIIMSCPAHPLSAAIVRGCCCCAG